MYYKMKQRLLTLILVLAGILGSCKKTYTCSCPAKGVKTTTETPVNGNPSRTYSSNVDYINENVYKQHTKKEVKRLQNCRSRSETTVSTYTKNANGGVTDYREVTTVQYN